MYYLYVAQYKQISDFPESFGEYYLVEHLFIIDTDVPVVPNNLGYLMKRGGIRIVKKGPAIMHSLLHLCYSKTNFDKLKLQRSNNLPPILLR